MNTINIKRVVLKNGKGKTFPSNCRKLLFTLRAIHGGNGSLYQFMFDSIYLIPPSRLELRLKWFCSTVKSFHNIDKKKVKWETEEIETKGAQNSRPVTKSGSDEILRANKKRKSVQIKSFWLCFCRWIREMLCFCCNLKCKSWVERGLRGRKGIPKNEFWRSIW